MVKQLIVNEASLLTFIDCDKVIKVVDLYEFKGRIWMFMDYMDLASQEKIILKNRQERQYSEEFVKYTLFHTALAIHAMHSKNILHRDIKSDNILSSSDGKIKIADLGFSAFLSDKDTQRKTKRGTLNWIAPEIHLGQLYSKEIDIWSYGCYAFELATGQPPFSSLQGQALVNAIKNKHHGQIDRNRWSEDFQDFIDRCLEKDKKDRFTI